MPEVERAVRVCPLIELQIGLGNREPIAGRAIAFEHKPKPIDVVWYQGGVMMYPEN